MTASAALVAMVVGVVGIRDAVAWYNSGANLYQPFHDSNTPDALPLVDYGIAMAVAWTCTTQAVLRIASMEATHLLSKGGGVPQRELSEIPGLKWPRGRWL